MVDAVEIRGLQVTAVGLDVFDLWIFRQKLTAEKVAVERAHAVALCQQHRHQRRTDIATGTGHKDELHVYRTFLSDRL